MNQGEKQSLTQIVERCKAINAQLKELKFEAKELEDSAWEACGVRPKVVRQLAKEAAWDQVRREEQRQHEESLDQCRAALGLLADLPLGQAATAAHANGGDPNVVPLKRGRGRPKGSRNKPKDETGAWVRPPEPQPPKPADPPVPDFPDAA